MTTPCGSAEVIVVVGATATGKSELALQIAAAVGGEIVNADAFQLYRGMDIGTGKVPATDRRGIAHHLLDVVQVDQEVTVAQYQGWGRRVLSELRERDRPAVVVGGSGLYVRALVDDLQFPGSDPALRRRWENVLADVGARELHAILARRDPAAAAHIAATNTRRVVRALEVGELTERPFSAVLPKAGPQRIAHRSVGLFLDRSALDRRIQQRVARMLADGWQDEVRVLLQEGLRDAPTASRALGYQQLTAVIDGTLRLSEAEGLITSATQRFARRQEKWFRRDPRTEWFDASLDPASTASFIAARKS